MAELQSPILPKRLYRYRSFARGLEAVQQELDSITQRYLYCSFFSNMNDPMEGFFSTDPYLNTSKRAADEIEKSVVVQKSEMGIASLTETCENSLMWAHYAGNYNGICVAYSAKDLVDGLPADSKLAKLAYVDEPPILYREDMGRPEAAVEVLSQKKYNWAYEREWRVLALGTGRIPIASERPVRKIYLGSRVAADHRALVVSTVRDLGIKVYAMDIDGYDHLWERIHPAK